MVWVVGLFVQEEPAVFVEEVEEQLYVFQLVPRPRADGTVIQVVDARTGNAQQQW